MTDLPVYQNILLTTDFSELSVDKIKISAAKRAAKAVEDTPEAPKTDNVPPVAEAQEEKS